MTTLLMVRIDEQWPGSLVAAWVVLGADGRLHKEGVCDPRHWPATDEVCLVLAGGQCVWIEVTVPKVARQDSQRVLRYALEDRLLEDPEQQHLTITHRRGRADGASTQGVLVISRERMRALLAPFAALGRAPTRCVAELQTAPASGDGAWHVAVCGDYAVVRTGRDAGYAVDTPLLATLLDAQWTCARLDNLEPCRVRLHLSAGESIPALPESDSLEIADTYHWWRNAMSGSSLLHGVFAVGGARSGLRKALEAPAKVLVLALGLWMVIGLGEIAWRHHQLQGLEARIARAFQTALPNEPLVLPALQMRQQLNLERTRHGLLRDDDALALLAIVAQALGKQASNSLTRVQFEQGRLELELGREFKVATLPGVRARLISQGLLAETVNEQNGVRLIVRVAPPP
jgi:general secretion pathway protein L